MWAPKRAGRHPSAGTVYYWSLLVVFLTMTALSILRWPHKILQAQPPYAHRNRLIRIVRSLARFEPVMMP